MNTDHLKSVIIVDKVWQSLQILLVPFGILASFLGFALCQFTSNLAVLSHCTVEACVSSNSVLVGSEPC